MSTSRDCVCNWFIVRQEADIDKAVAVLWLIGGVDSRLRLGGTISHEEFGSGTVASVATSGEINVQFDGIRAMKTCHMQDLRPVSFALFL